MNINAVTLEIDGNEVTMQILDGVLHIDAPRHVAIDVCFRDAGIPGIIGPEVLINCNSVLGDILSNAIKAQN